MVVAPLMRPEFSIDLGPDLDDAAFAWPELAPGARVRRVKLRRSKLPGGVCK